MNQKQYQYNLAQIINRMNQSLVHGSEHISFEDMEEESKREINRMSSSNQSTIFLLHTLPHTTHRKSRRRRFVLQIAYLLLI